eukprot:scaffold781_cov132-Cylindrotheca_fusiformis.AAC.20
MSESESEKSLKKNQYHGAPQPPETPPSLHSDSLAFSDNTSVRLVLDGSCQTIHHKNNGGWRRDLPVVGIRKCPTCPLFQYSKEDLFDSKSKKL